MVGVDDLPLAAAADQDAGVADLAAGLGIRGRAVEDDLDLVTRARLAHTSAIRDQGQDRGRGGERLVADEELWPRQRALDLLIERDRLARVAVAAEAGPGAGALALRLHLLRPHPLGILGDAPALVDENLLREVAREAVRVVQGEQQAPVDGPARAAAVNGR